MNNDKDYLSPEDSAAIMDLVEQAHERFIDAVFGSKAAYPVEFKCIGGNGAFIQGFFPACGESPVFADNPEGEEMRFPITYVATDSHGRKIVEAKMEQPVPITENDEIN